MRIDKSEGQSVVYKTLDQFAKQPLQNLPDIFDVLNCAEGCNAGTACIHKRNIFEINSDMETARRAASANREKPYFDDLYRDYDKRFRLEHYIRHYTPAPVRTPQVTEADMERAYALLGKDTVSKRKYDCGACGCHTCYEMARKIALNVNLPENCIQKNRDDVKMLVGITRDVDSIRTHSDTIMADIEAVNASISNFDHMAKAIDDIAMQINIISINASIESARAGEFGKVFAVIAKEIQALAKNSKKTVEKSSELSVEANRSIKDVTAMMAQVVQAVKTAHDAIQKIN